MLVQRDQRRARLREPRHRDPAPQEGVGLRRLRRVRLHRRRRAAGVPAGQPGRRAVRPRCCGGRAGRGRAGAQRRHRLGDGQHEHPRLRRAAARPAPDLDVAAQRRGQPDPAGEVPRRPLRPPVRRPDEGDRPGQLPHRRTTGPQPATPRTSRWSCSRTTAARCRSSATKKTAVIGPLGDDKHDMLGPWWGQGKDEDAVRVRRASRPRTRTRRSPGLHPGQHRQRAGSHPDDACSNADIAAVTAAAHRPTRWSSPSARPAR